MQALGNGALKNAKISIALKVWILSCELCKISESIALKVWITPVLQGSVLIWPKFAGRLLEIGKSFKLAVLVR